MEDLEQQYSPRGLELVANRRLPSGPDKLAFVLSGGGSLGSVQVGCLEALMQHGIYPDLIVGTSVGALNAAFLATNPTMEGVARLKEIWLSMERRGYCAVSTLDRCLFNAIARCERRAYYSF